MKNMMKLKENFQAINFNVPETYSDAKSLMGVTSVLRDWDQLKHRSKLFNFSWQKIIQKIKIGKQLTDKEIFKAVLYFRLIPSEIVENLERLVINNENSEILKKIALYLNNNFKSISSIRFFLNIMELDEFNKSNFSNGIILFQSEIIQYGWEGLVDGVIRSNLNFDKMMSAFSVNNKTPRESVVALIKGVLQLDTNAIKFDKYAVAYAKYLLESNESNLYISEKFDSYLGCFLKRDTSWEGKVISNDYSPVQLMNFYLDQIGCSPESLPPNVKRIFNQRNNLENAIDLLNKEEPDRGNFWKEYMPYANRVVSKRGTNKVAVAFFFGDIVIVEFAPVGNAAYIYKTEVFEKYLLNLRDATDWKSSEKTLLINGFTRSKGTKHHHHGWQKDFSRFLNKLIKAKR